MGEEPDRIAMVSDLRMEAGALRAETTSLRAEMAATRDELSGRIDRLETKLTNRIVEESETTRRHFDIMVEKVEAAVRIVAEVNAHHAVVLDNHEFRLKKIEKAR